METITRPRVIAKITKINNLVEVSTQARKSSTSLRKVFEKGSYQKKTQLTVLNRYKKRLDSIQRQNDRSFKRRRTAKVKLPDIKKYAGNFLRPTSDPLKAIAALAAFKAIQKGAKGDVGGALGSGLIAAGLTFGPALLGGGIGLLKNKFSTGAGPAEKPSPSSGGGGKFFGTPYSQTKAGQAYAGMQRTRNLPKWAQKAAGGSASRYAASNLRMFQGTANIGDRARLLSRKFGFGGIGGMAESVAAKGGGIAAEAATAKTGGTIAAKIGGVSARAIPLLSTAVNVGLSAYRFSQGDVVGGILSAVSAIPVVGWAALGIDLAREFGAFDGTFLGRRGKDKLEQKTKEQKKIVEQQKKSEGELTFSKTLNRYERVVNKFEEFSKQFKIKLPGEFTEPSMPEPTQVAPGGGYIGPVSGDTFFPLPGGDVGTMGKVNPGQAFGAPRDGGTRSHKGLDMTHHTGALDAAVAAYKSGKVVAAVSGGYNGYVEIDHGGGLRTLYYHTTPMVRVGEVVYGGQQIAKLYPAGDSTHLHFGISNNGAYTDPLPYVKSVKNRIPTVLTREKAQQNSFNSLQNPIQQISTPPTQQPLRPASVQTPRPTLIQPSRPSIRPQTVSLNTTLPYQRQTPQQVIVQLPTQQQQQPMSSAGESVYMPLDTADEMLNTYYKRVLLNTLQ